MISLHTVAPARRSDHFARLKSTWHGHPRSLAVVAIVVAVIAALFATPSRADAADTVSIRPGSTVSLPVGTTSALNVTTRATLSVDQLPKSGTSLYSAVQARVGTQGAYIAQVRTHPTGVTYLSIKRENGTGATRKTATLVADKAVATSLKPGQAISVSLTVSGSTSVAISATARIGTATATVATTTDSSTSRLLAAGLSKLTLYTPSTTQVLKVTVTEKTVTVTPTPTPTPTPKPTPTPTSTPAPTPAPVRTFPTAANTGVPAGVTLRVHQGDLVVKTANAVIDGLEVRGSIIIEAPGVLIRNSRIVGGATPSSVGLVHNVVSGQPFRIIDSELHATTEDPRWNGIFGSNFTAERLEIYNVVDPIRVIGNNVTIRGSWLHDNSYWVSDPLRNGTPTHDDSIQIEAGGSIVIEGNRLEGSHNAAVQVTQNTRFATLGAITIRDNYIQGGSCTLNFAATPAVFHPTISNNVFGPDRVHKTCAVIAPTANAPVLTGNIWEATSLPMSTYVVVGG